MNSINPQEEAFFEKDQKSNIPTFRKGQLSDLAELKQLFVNTIMSCCKEDYNSEQIKAWASSIENEQRWLDILKNQFVLVALDADKIIGFCTLKDGDYIDLLYVHKDYLRQKTATILYLNIEKEAKQQGAKELTADVSITAKPFFEKIGFRVLKEQKALVNNVELTNYKMTKTID